MADIKSFIENGQAVMGLELGSTRIKAVLVDGDHNPIASGDYEWENKLVDGIWTYDMESVWEGIAVCYENMVKDVQARYGAEVTRLKAIGFSAMMHGYLAFDQEGNLLVPFRTWRNTITGEAAKELSELFKFNVPQRWTVSHVRQCMLNKEPHTANLDKVFTLASYIHYRLTGERVVGVGEASGMFPIDSNTCDFDETMVQKFNALIRADGFNYDVRELFPKVLSAGEYAGILTEEGVKLLDRSGKLEAGVPLAPPEGDAGTGMAATNSVLKRTGNVSAGTSVFSMVVLEKALSDYYEEIDMVTTPDGAPVAMVHCNNCTSDLNAWVGLFKQTLELMGHKVDMNELYGNLYRNAMNGAPDCGGLMAYNYVSGEAITNMMEGRPLFVRKPDADFSIANFMRTHLYSALATLKYGNDILMKRENVSIDTMYGHGGLFKTKGVGQQVLADALNSTVSVMQTAGEGGPWGMALLSSYMVNKEEGETLPAFLQDKVFHGEKGEALDPDPAGVKGFDDFIAAYTKGLKAEAAAVETL